MNRELRSRNEQLFLIREDPWVTEASGTTELAHPSCIPLDGNWIQLGESEANDNHVLVGEYACLFCGKGDLIVAGPQPGEAYARRKAAKTALIRHTDDPLGALNILREADGRIVTQRRDPILKTETKPVPRGGLTNSTPGMTDRVQRALDRAAAKASTVGDTEGEVMA